MIISYKLTKLGLPPTKNQEDLDVDLADAFLCLQNEDYKIEWEARIELAKKIFGGK